MNRVLLISSVFCLASVFPPVAGAESRADEECWIVGEVVGHLGLLAEMAAGEEPGNGAVEVRREGESSYRVKVAGVEALVVPASHLWAAGDYRGVVAELIKKKEIKPAGIEKDLPGDELAANLTALGCEVLRKENAVVSTGLRNHPGSALMHYRAAFLLGAFALRENSGHFHDTRIALNKMAAHYAWAEGLDRRGGIAAEAEVRLLPILSDVLVGRELEAVGALEKFDAKGSAEKAWAGALDLQVRMDWREYEGKEPKTLLEKVSLFKAWKFALSSGTAMEGLEKWGEPAAVADFSRILASTRLSVPGGHFNLRRFGLELEEAALAAGVEFDGFEKEALEDLGERLNLRPGTGAGKAFAVIDDGDWCQHSQRHLLNVVMNQSYWFQRMLGDREAAENFREMMEALVSKLELFPLMGFEVWNFSPEEEDANAKAIEKLASTTPWMIPARRWRDAEEEEIFTEGIRAGEFMKKLAPTGTNYNIYHRRGLVGWPSLEPAELREIRERVPYQPMLAIMEGFMISRSGDSIEELDKAVGTLVPYHAKLARARAESLADDPNRYADAMRLAAKLSPDMNAAFGDYLLARGEVEEAMGCYQKQVDDGVSPVKSSKVCGALVDFYLDEGKVTKAKAAAEFGAEVYSHAGLEAMINFCLRQKDESGAEEWAVNLAQRYGDPMPLMRVCRSFPGLREKYRYDDFLKELFPGGLREVAVGDLSGEPEAGMTLDGNSVLLVQNGLSSGVLVVAAQGYLIEDGDQYDFAVRLKPGSTFTLIVYEDGKYREVEARAPGRRFGVSTADYRR